MSKFTYNGDVDATIKSWTGQLRNEGSKVAANETNIATNTTNITTNTTNITTNTSDIATNTSAITAINPTGSGIDTPSLTGSTNIQTATPYSTQYSWIEDLVTGYKICTVSGRVDIDTNTTGAAQLFMNFPIASNIANANECGGSAHAANGDGARIVGDATGNRVQLDLTSSTTSNNPYGFTYQYRIIPF